MGEQNMLRILFVCLGNICRSPAAQAVFEKLLVQHQLTGQIEVDSAGILDYHEGEEERLFVVAHFHEAAIPCNDPTLFLPQLSVPGARNKELSYATRRQAADRARLSAGKSQLPLQSYSPVLQGSRDCTVRRVNSAANRVSF